MRDPLHPIETSVELGVCGSIMRCTHVQITLSPSPGLSNFVVKIFLKQLKRYILFHALWAEPSILLQSAYSMLHSEGYRTAQGLSYISAEVCDKG